MATKPVKLPRWATDPGADVVEPSEGQKDDGWDVSDRPPAGWWNWLQELNYDWLLWIDTVFDDGSAGNIVAVAGLESVATETNGVGVKGTGGSGNGIGVVGLATGTAYGGWFEADTDGTGVAGVGKVNGPGVAGNGGSAGDGGQFQGGGGVAVGVRGTGSANGAGGVFSGGSTSGDGSRNFAVGTGKDGSYGEGPSTSPGDGAGVRGKGFTGYGVIAESDLTSPAKAALRIIPQNADPNTSPQTGDVIITSATHTDGEGYVKVYNGTSWVKIGTQT